ncbi:HlyD family efflux transporter periplasmic adaptor subunit [Breoghania sp. JC706]|uniref:efflux RND transporter periplasmic adaptor subunit n=1 Tax=Breoghania sp. JC706 TaxID=3117732 RepID=UPI0030099F82
MSVALRRVLLWGTLLALVAAALFFTLRPQPVPVDFVTVARGPLQVAVEAEGETRIRDVYRVSAPVTGRLTRIKLEAGDTVEADRTLVAELQPIDPGLRDMRTEAELRAAVQAAEAALALAEANIDSARAELGFAETDLDRVRRLAASETVSKRRLDEAELSLRKGRAALAQAIATANMRRFELDRARTQLLSTAEAIGQRDSCPCVPIRAPVSGKVLRVLQESEVVVQAGTTLVEVGDPRDLEIVTDLLSADAVKVQAGQEVVITDWGGDEALAGRVKRVEPFGFTKVSALGIEEQRVNVVIELTGPPETYARLAHGFRVEVAIVLWKADDVARLPLTALFRKGDRWMVFKVEDGIVRQVPVETGHGNGLAVEIVGGVRAGDTVVAHPSDRVVDGIAVQQRETE